jgi:hypothetical protein
MYNERGNLMNLPQTKEHLRIDNLICIRGSARDERATGGVIT